MLLIHKDISHMPITELENDSESVWVKVFANKTSYFVRGSSNKEWDFLHSLKICVRIKFKVTTIIEQYLSNSEMEPMFL